MDRDYLDLCELQRLLREGIESFFPDRLWVKAEISSVQVKANGHCYLELCSSEGGRVVAKAKAVIWRSRYQAVAAYFEEVTGSSLAAGMEVLVRVSVSYSELYGLTLTIDEVEPEYTVGAAELRKRKTVEQLLGEPHHTSLPPFPLWIWCQIWCPEQPLPAGSPRKGPPRRQTHTHSGQDVL